MSLATDVASADTVFPPGKTFKSMYSILCLSEHLETLRGLVSVVLRMCPPGQHFYAPC